MNALFAALVNGGVASALVAALIWTLLKRIPRRVVNAATRYAVWWMTAVLTIVMPAFFIQKPAAPVATVEYSAPLPPLAPAITAPLQVTPAPYAAAAPTRPAATVRRPSFPRLPLKLTDERWPRGVLFAWAAFSILFLIRLAVSYTLLKRVEARSVDLPASLQARFEGWISWARTQRRGIRIAASPEISTPVAVGPWKPRILIPATLCDQLRSSELEQVGLHEAAHLVRRDDWALVIQRTIEAVFALHPVIRWIARNIDLEREIACDDLVVAATGSPASYAGCLIRVVELSGGVRASLAAATAGEDNSHLTRRVNALLDRTRTGETSLVKMRLAIMAAVMISAAMLAGKVSSLVAFAMPLMPGAASRVNLLPARISIAPMQPASSGQSPNLAGKVLEDSTGAPVASAELRFRRAGMRELAADIETDRQGGFAMPELPAGEYSVEVRKPNFINTAFRLQLPSGSPTIRLVRYGVIDGQVTDVQGNPLPGRVYAAGGRTDGYTRVAVLVKQPGRDDLQIFREAEIADGHYRIYDLPPGEYSIGLWYNNLAAGSGMQMFPDSAHPRVFSIQGGEEYTNINFTAAPKPAWRVSGRVLIPAGVKGIFQMALGLPEQPTLPLATTLSSEDGSFRFEKVPAGTYQLFASGPTGGYGAYDSILRNGVSLFARLQVQVAGSDLDDVQVPLSNGGSVKVVLKAAGTDRAPEGCPQTTRITAQALEPWALSLLGAVQATFGKEQSLANLPPGRFRLTAAELGPNCFQVSQPVAEVASDSEGTPVAIEVGAAGTVSGSVRNAGAGAYGIVLLPSGAISESSASLAYPAPDGRFRFDSVRPGDYRISAQPLADAKARWVSGRRNAIEIHVKAGAATNIDLNAAVEGGR